MAFSRVAIAGVVIAMTGLAVSGAVFAAGFESSPSTLSPSDPSQSRAEQPVEPEMGSAATVAARFNGIGVALRSATAPGLACLVLEDVATLDGGTMSGVCTQRTVIDKHGLLLSFNEANGNVTYYGIGPAGTKAVRHNGALLGTQREGLFVLRGVPASSSGRFTFEVGSGSKALEFGPLPPLPVP
jgi:hypothetical protein